MKARMLLCSIGFVPWFAEFSAQFHGKRSVPSSFQLRSDCVPRLLSAVLLPSVSVQLCGMLRSIPWTLKLAEMKKKAEAAGNQYMGGCQNYGPL